MDPERASRAGRSAPGQSHGSETEQRILAGAAELLAEGISWNALGIRQVAERAELSRTAFYDFFATKNDLIIELLTARHEELAAILGSRENGFDGHAPDLADPAPVLRALADFNALHGDIYRAFLQACTDDADLEAAWRSIIHGYVRLIARAIDRTRVARPGIPQAPASEAVAESLVLMTERTMVVLHRLPGAGDAEQERRLAALAHVWRSAVFGSGD